MVKVYTLSNCDRCRVATKWLRARGVAFEEIPIRERPPQIAELRRAFAEHGGQLRPLFNAAGRDYREQGLADKLPSLTNEAAFKLLAGNGNLVKRPFLVAGGVARAGFDEAAWERIAGYA